ncbi:excalibur calcium-binding domain-containing protein [Rothia nasimurium]|uniref:excalibur calcium-binding domain-containing protein n=1 Tax=Rothia nasimurium TaxID=85336 RepID=UPI0023516F65|nr:excalibur calcium-binding domain-containing protein [Rothia nasimurium]
MKKLNVRKRVAASALALTMSFGALGLGFSGAQATDNVIADEALKACVNANINEYLKTRIPSESNRALNAPVTQTEVQEYLRNPLNCSPANLTDLGASKQSVSSLEGLQYAINLRSINIRNDAAPVNQRISDMSPIAKLPTLHTVNLRSNNIATLPADLSGMRSLQTLTLDNNDLTSIAPVAGLTNLTKLELQYNRITSLQGVENLKNLKQLLIGGASKSTGKINQVTSLEPLRNLTELENLTADNNLITDLSPLTNLNKLSRVILANNNSQERLGTKPTVVMDVSPLANKPLTTLNINYNWVDNISALSTITTFGNPDLYDPEVPGRAGKVSVMGNRIADLTPLNAVPASARVIDGQEPFSTAAPRTEVNGNTEIDISGLKNVDGTIVNVSSVVITGSKGRTIVNPQIVGNKIVIPGTYPVEIVVNYVIKGAVTGGSVMTLYQAAETPAPVEPTVAPVEPTVAPVEPTVAPVEPTVAPVEPTVAPVEPTVAPVEPTVAPVEPTVAPVEPTVAPVEPTVAPVEPTAAPSESSVAPVAPVAPVVTAAPVAPVVKPSLEKVKAEKPFVYENCAAVHAAKAAPIREGDYGWHKSLDADGDGVGCEVKPDYENKKNTTSNTVAQAEKKATSQKKLANTGADTAVLVGTGLALLATGAGAFMAARRRKA